MLFSGCEWCNFVVYTQEDMFVERIHCDNEITDIIKERVDCFFSMFTSALSCVAKSEMQCCTILHVMHFFYLMVIFKEHMNMSLIINY